MGVMSRIRIASQMQLGTNWANGTCLANLIKEWQFWPSQSCDYPPCMASNLISNAIAEASLFGHY